MPFFEPIVEDEIHVLCTCIKYEDLRQKLSADAKTAIFSDIKSIFSSNILTREIARFMVKVNKRRFAKKKKEAKAQKKKKEDGANPQKKIKV